VGHYFLGNSRVSNASISIAVHRGSHIKHKPSACLTHNSNCHQAHEGSNSWLKMDMDSRRNLQGNIRFCRVCVLILYTATYTRHIRNGEVKSKVFPVYLMMAYKRRNTASLVLKHDTTRRRVVKISPPPPPPPPKRGGGGKTPPPPPPRH